jgi:hypothetical protein
MKKISVTKFRQHILSEHKRPMLTIVALAILAAGLLAMIIIFIVSLMSDEAPRDNGSVTFAQNIGTPTLNDDFDPELRGSIEAKNLEEFDKARSQAGGMSIPFVINDQTHGDDEQESFGTCGCEPMSDEQFREMLARSGVSYKGSETLARRVGKSDIYIDGKRYITNKDGSRPYLFNQRPIKI